MPRPHTETFNRFIDQFADFDFDTQERLLLLLPALHRQKDREVKRERRRAPEQTREPQPAATLLDNQSESEAMR